jgi:hypothetical protein
LGRSVVKIRKTYRYLSKTIVFDEINTQELIKVQNVCGNPFENGEYTIVIFEAPKYVQQLIVS